MIRRRVVKRKPISRKLVDDQRVNKFGVASKAVILNGNKFLLIKKRKLDDLSKVEWDIPGGRLEFGERPQETILREIREEVHLNVRIIGVSNVWSVKLDNFQLVGITFICEYLGGDLKTSKEHTKALWVEFSKIEELEIPHWLRTDIELAVKAYLKLKDKEGRG